MLNPSPIKYQHYKIIMVIEKLLRQDLPKIVIQLLYNDDDHR